MGRTGIESVMQVRYSLSRDFDYIHWFSIGSKVLIILVNMLSKDLHDVQSEIH